MTGFGENHLGNVGESSNNISEFYTNQVFMSHPDMMQWVQNSGRQHGYVIVTERSKKNARRDVTKVFLKCDRGGEYKGTSTVRRSATRKTGCRFQLIGKYMKDVNGWMLLVKHAEHNHPPAQHLEGHPFAMRLTDQEMHLLEDLSKHDVQPRNILATLKEQNPENVSSLKTLYNARQKIRKATEIGSTPMQVLFSLLHSKGYIWEHQESDGFLGQLFFIHKTSYKMWRAFPHVFLIDATYKTNRYNMPFVEIVGVTSTKKTYCVAFALISKEKQDNFIWVLNNLKVALNKCMEPYVIITDRDLALMNACKRVFPEAVQLLCRWHISQNIGKHCKQGLDSHEWAVLHTMWGVLIDSPTADIYNYNYKLLHQMFSGTHQRVLDYLNDTWLSNYKEMFVSAWIDKNLNFGNRTTNRAESQHSLFKKYVSNPNSRLHELVQGTDKLIKDQEGQINESFEISRIRVYNQHRRPLFNLLRGNVSLKALDLICEELDRLNELIDSPCSSCGCRLQTSCGLPCTCILANYLHVGQPIPLDAIDIFWRKIDFTPSFVHPDDNIDLDEEFEVLKQEIKAQPTSVKRSWLKKIKEMINPSQTNLEEPIVHKNTRGRPTLKMKQEKNKEPARHSSFVNFQEPAGHNSFVNSQDPVRHSSFVDSQDPARHSSFVNSQDPTSNVIDFMGCREESSIHGSFVNKRNMVTPQDLYYFNQYESQIPSIFHPYVSRVQDVIPDGNCGFRSVAVALGYGEEQWFFIRNELRIELIQYEAIYRRVFDTTYDELLHTLSFFGTGAAPQLRWMLMPYTGFLIANRFGVIVISLTPLYNGSTTVFPLWTRQEHLVPHRTVTTCHVYTNHFIMIELTGIYPMPTVNILWKSCRYPDAEGWEMTYMSQLEMYDGLISGKHTPAGYVVID